MKNKSRFRFSIPNFFSNLAFIHPIDYIQIIKIDEKIYIIRNFIFFFTKHSITHFIQFKKKSIYNPSSKKKDLSKKLDQTRPEFDKLKNKLAPINILPLPPPVTIYNRSSRNYAVIFQI